MTTHESRRIFLATVEQIEAACNFVIALAESAGMADEAIYHCRLSVEEICTNVIEHGYAGRGAAGVIEIVCRTDPQQGFMITIIDDAPAFNPLSLPAPDPATPLWERKGGGWGVYFVRTYMDRVGYRYQHGRNHFTMEKNLR